MNTASIPFSGAPRSPGITGRSPRIAQPPPGAEPTPPVQEGRTLIDPATHRLLLDRLTVYTSAAAHILRQWDDYSDLHVDDQGWPLDDIAYGRRQRQRDAHTWRAFEPIHPHTTQLLATAQHQLTVLPAAEQQPDWLSALTRLSDARTGLDNTLAIWQAEHDALPVNAVPGTEAYDDVLAERNADAWSYLRDWADHGHTLSEIARAAARHECGHRAAQAVEDVRACDNGALPPQDPGRSHRRGQR